MNAAQSAGLKDAALALTQPVIEALLTSICRRIRDAGAVTDTAEYEIYRAQALGATKKEIEKAVARQLSIQEPVIESLFEYVLDKTVAFQDDGSLQQIASGYAKLAQQWSREKLQNLWAAAPDGKVLPLQDAYAKSLDFAFRQTVTGALDQQAAIRQACDGLAKRGLRTIELENGRSIGIEFATRRYLMTTLGDLNDEIERRNFEELNCDGWEVDAHLACAPDHEPYQGRQYSVAEFEELNEKLQRPLGNRHYGCKHNVFGIILGVNRPQYSESELREMREKNEQGIDFDGQHYSLYEATQEQARMENAIWHLERRLQVAEESGDAKAESLRIRMQVLRQTYNRFCQQAGLPMRFERMRVAGLQRSRADRAVWTYRKASDGLQDSGATLYPVTKESIDAVPMPFFEGLTNKMNRKAQQLGKELLGKVFGKPIGTEAAVSFTVDGSQTLWEIGDEAAARVHSPHLNEPFYSLHNHASNGILSPGDILTLIRDDRMRGIGAIGHKGALFTCEKMFSFDRERAEEFFKRIKRQHPAYKTDPEQERGLLEAFMKEATKYGFRFKEG